MAQRNGHNGGQKRFVVLDRDGTIIVEKHYLSEPEQVKLLPGAAQALGQMQAMDLGLIVITNQSGVNRGYFDGKQLDLIHHRLSFLLQAEKVQLDGIFYCPHIPGEDCRCRKPRTGLLDIAAEELGFKPEECFVIGDKSSDIELGQNVGATTFLVSTGYGVEVAKDETTYPDHSVAGLLEAVQVIQGLLEPANRA